MAERLTDVLANKQNLSFTEEQQDALEELGYEKRGFWYAKDGRMASKIELAKALSENKPQPADEDQYPLQIWMFSYDAKNKARLPIWDMFPVVVVTNITSGGFAGINIHYIEKQARLMLLQEIYQILDEGGGPEEAIQLVASLGVGYKKYLNSHVRTGRRQIPRAMWEEAFDTPGNFIYR
jgi:hypothetical protein